LTSRPTTNDTRFSVGRSFALWAVCWVSGIILGQIAFALTGHSGEAADLVPTSTTAVSIVFLWTPFLIGLVLLSRSDGSGRFFADYRLGVRWIDIIGVPLGVVSQMVLVPVLYWALRQGWHDAFSADKVEQRARDLWDRADGVWVVVLVLVVAVGAPLVEELVYRGLIQQALQSRINEILAVVVAAAFFAAIHFQPVEFPGLFLFGLVLGVLYQRTGRLGAPILAHVAFNAAGLYLAAR